MVGFDSASKFISFGEKLSVLIQFFHIWPKLIGFCQFSSVLVLSHQYGITSNIFISLVQILSLIPFRPYLKFISYFRSDTISLISNQSFFHQKCRFHSQSISFEY